jgi:hypothetical protein
LLPYRYGPHTTCTRIWPLTELVERARRGEGGREREKEGEGEREGE